MRSGRIHSAKNKVGTNVALISGKSAYVTKPYAGHLLT